MNKYKLLYLIFLFPFCLFAQNKVNKSTLQKIIRESQVEKIKGKFSLPSDKSWKFNNIDSLYFKLDTIVAIRYKDSKQKSLCEQVDWTFYKKNAFIRGKESKCKEPPLRSVTKYPSDYFTFVIYNIENHLIIDVLRNDKMIIESFIVLEIEDNKSYSKIKLVRRFNPY